MRSTQQRRDVIVKAMQRWLVRVVWLFHFRGPVQLAQGPVVADVVVAAAAARGHVSGVPQRAVVLIFVHHHGHQFFGGKLRGGRRDASQQAGLLVELAPLREGDAVAEAGEHGQEPGELVVPEDLLEVVELSQVEGELVGAVSEDWRSEGLQGGHVARDQVEVIEEERGDTDGEHCAHEEQEQHMEPEKQTWTIRRSWLEHVMRSHLPGSDCVPVVDQKSRKYLSEDKAT